MNAALNQVLMEAAAKELRGNLSDMMPKSAVRKLDPKKEYAPYDLTLGEFYIPGRTRREEPSEEQKMVLGLKAYVKTLQDENNRLRALVPSERDKARQAALEEGRKAGFEAGLKQGKAESTSAAAKVQANLTAVLKDFAVKKEAVLEKSERKTLEIVFSAVEHILRRECSLDNKIVLNVIRAALAEAGQSDRITLRVNPKEVEAVNAGKDFWQPVNNTLSGITIEEDPRVTCGGVVIESLGGTVDGRLETQLENLREIFLKCWEQGAGAIT
ncbi:MAG: hypothetical protein A2293_00830 [Elusimicrobia bacterium RIFOXYB2_FULL_49_7]|nr:MAG: hypothetical protein A2293_00830 [Elusimicrobia bacterium RIFOXYB2_FULL_49_7]